MTTSTTLGSFGLRYAITDCGCYAIVRFADGKGYSKRSYSHEHGWCLDSGSMPPNVERALCRRLGLACKLDPAPLADAPWICGPNE